MAEGVAAGTILLKDDSSVEALPLINTDGRVHSNVKSFMCDFCGKRFTDNSNFKRHLRIHTGEKPFECDVCKRKFSNGSHLKDHLRTHTGEKPYECDICKRKFAQESNLKAHLRIHTGEKPFECHICKRNFSRGSSLKDHMRTHSDNNKPYEYSIFEGHFPHDSSLQLPLKIQTIEKPFECDICKKRFSVSCNLKTHYRTHTGEKPFECGICMKRFYSRSHQKRHMRVHRDDKPFQPEDAFNPPPENQARGEGGGAEDENFVYIKEEVSDGFDNDSCLDGGGESQNDNDSPTDVSGPVDLRCHSVRESSRAMDSDVERESRNDALSLNIKSENVHEEMLSHMVETVFGDGDDNDDCQIRSEKNDLSENI